MGTHGTGSGRRHTPKPTHKPPPTVRHTPKRVTVTRRPTHKPRAPAVPPAPAAPKARDELPAAAQALVDVLQRMPWCRDHRPECPAASAGPCTCGSVDLVAAMAHLDGLLHP